MTERHDAPRARRSTALASPWVSALLGVLAVALAVTVALVSGALPFPSPAASAAATCTPGAPSTSAPPTGAATPATGTSGPCLPTAGPSVSVEPTFVRPTATPAPTFTSYMVREGDTLTSIALAFHTTVRSLSWWNRGPYPALDPESPAYDPNSLTVGWILVLIPGQTVDEANPPTPSPGGASPSALGPTPGPTLPVPVPGGPATAISYGPRGSSVIALTFDMGGRLDPALDILSYLVANGVHATIFPTGETGSGTTTGRAVMDVIAQHPQLFDIGNHSWDHPDFTTLTAAQMKAELVQTEEAIAPLAGQTTLPWFRPPYGAWNTAVRQGVGAAGWEYLVLWDIDTIDWKPTTDGGPTTDDIVTKVLSKAQGGSIVLMHLGGYHTLDALPAILAGLRQKGLTPVTLGEMFGR